MIVREIKQTFLTLAEQFPIVTLTGPRQSGKTTLSQICFQDKPYISLENPDTLEFALADPRRFLNQFPNGAILDEIQRAPQLFSYLQGIVDEHKKIGDIQILNYQHSDKVFISHHTS